MTKREIEAHNKRNTGPGVMTNRQVEAESRYQEHLAYDEAKAMGSTKSKSTLFGELIPFATALRIYAATYHNGDFEAATLKLQASSVRSKAVENFHSIWLHL